MSKDVKDNVGYLGNTYQLKAFWQILTDASFGETTLPYLESSYFDDGYFRRLISILKDYNEKNARVPSIKNGSVYEIINEVKLEETEKEVLTKITDKIVAWQDGVVKGEIPFDGDVIQQKIYRFIKQQEYKNLGDFIQGKVKVGKVDDEFVIETEDKIKRISAIGQKSSDGVDLFYNIDDVLREDYRETIPTGIEKIDILMHGGLGKGELGLILAAPGTGKSTVLSKIANTALNHGKNVLQIIFEDTEKDIIRKHFCVWSGIPLPEMSAKAPFVKEKVIEKQNELKSRLVLLKFSDEGITIPFIERWIMDYQKRTGVIFDLIVLDYIDCVESHKKYKDKLDEELRVIKSFISLIDRLDIPGWSAVQGNRDSVSAAFIQSDQISGNFKKTHKVHFMMSIAKTALQKTFGRANIQILKSRVGDDGNQYEDVIFDNKKMLIDISDKPFKITKEEREAYEEGGTIETDSVNDLIKEAFGMAEPKAPVIEANTHIRNEVFNGYIREIEEAAEENPTLQDLLAITNVLEKNELKMEVVDNEDDFNPLDLIGVKR